MIFKMILQYSTDNKPFSRLFQVTSVEHSKDDIKILQHTVLNHIREGLLPIKNGGRFIIQNRNNTLSIVFSDAQSDRLFIVGNLKFYASMLGRDNMSGSWCMWCQLSPIEWKIPTTKRSPAVRDYEEEWTVDTLKAYKVKIDQGELTTANQMRSVVDYPVWDFVEVSNYIYPVLHGEIGLINGVLDNFYDFLDDKVEVLSEEEKVAGINTIIADVAHDKAKQRLSNWQGNEGVTLISLRHEKQYVQGLLKQRNTTVERKMELLEEKR